MTGPQVVNDVPQELLDLARRAVGRGFDRVVLGFEGLGADFPAPVGWLLHLTRCDALSLHALTGAVDVESRRAEHLIVDCQRGHAPTAYVAGRGFGVDYWDVAQIAAWIDSDTPLLTQPDEEERKLLLAEHDLFEAAAAAGWAVSHERNRADGLAVAQDLRVPWPLSFKLEVSAVNNHFNTRGHADSRWTGAPVSVSARLLVHHSADEPTRLARRSLMHAADPRVIAAGQSFDDVARSRAPWFVPVATFDDDSEEWVLPS